MDKLYLVHGNTWYDGYGYCENLYGVFTDRKTAEKVKTEVTEKLYEKEMHNINTHVESISDIEIDILEVDRRKYCEKKYRRYNKEVFTMIFVIHNLKYDTDEKYFEELEEA